MWIPFYKDAARWLRTAQLDNFGEAGTLLKVHVYADEQSCEFDEAGTREAVELWLDSFGVRYVEAIDDNMRDALLSVRRSLSGTFSRTSGDRPQNVTFPTPAHLFYSLSCHEFGRSLLCGMKVIETLLSSFSEEEDPMKVKAALMGLGHIGSHTEGFKLLPSPVVPQMVRIAEEFPVLSVRGYAFWALNLLSASLSGAAALARLGWESNRHRETLDYMLKKGDDDADTQPIPSPFSSNPQIIIRSPRSRSGSENRAQFSSRQRSSSAEMSKSTESTPRIASSLPRVRRTRSATDVCPGDDVQPRYERAVTGDSVFTSGLGSLSEDSTEVGRRQTAGLDSLIGEWESRSRTSTIAYCLHQGLIADKSHLAMQGTVADMVRDPHHSNAAREKWRLAPLKTKRTLEVNRNLADPAVYVYMTNDEELSLSRYRREVLGDPWLHDELLRREMEPTPSIQTSHMSHVIALPSEVNVICSNIFPSRYAVSAMDLIVSVFSPDATDEAPETSSMVIRMAMSLRRCA
ncbi:hypothetical protein NECAME_06644 [Necator americanus]|uniref:Rapamycin-insensitive companion of mTOR domain-containing protein n=1 Tax=Necator americanus TaxID=51031 RepID=W2TS13_NECAM|nr:hypothetical protein NECAME_06644 [Necator americanus]ETN84840.1 hypothetical protein NECAME_06644 [Necator americanus]